MTNDDPPPSQKTPPRGAFAGRLPLQSLHRQVLQVLRPARSRRPTTRKDFDYIRWYLLHDDATVFIEDGDWYLLVHTRCKHLQSDNRCGIYETRPQICRDYTIEDCEYEDDYVYDHYFETSEQVEEYVEAVLPCKSPAEFRTRRPPLLPVIS